METEVLKSRLQATCQAAGVPWSEKNRPATLAIRLLEKAPNAWDFFSKKYNIVFVVETKEFLDLAEIAAASEFLESEGERPISFLS